MPAAKYQTSRVRSTPRRCVRAAFSLLEVILALAILAGAIAVLGELTRGGLDHARRARDLAQAQLLCESKMAEILAGYEALEAVSDVPFGTGRIPDWLYSVETLSLDQDGLLELRVTVEQDLPPEKRPVECTLVRWMIDPAVFATEETTEGTTESTTGVLQ